MSEPRVTKTEILQACQGMLCKQLYVVFTKPVNGMGPVLQHLDAHLKFQIQLEKDGIMLGAGPFFTENECDWEGEGMVIIRADSLSHAKEIANSDPMHQSGARTFEVRPWLLNEGSVTVKVQFSSRSGELL